MKMLITLEPQVLIGWLMSHISQYGVVTKICGCFEIFGAASRNAVYPSDGFGCCPFYGGGSVYCDSHCLWGYVFGPCFAMQY